MATAYNPNSNEFIPPWKLKEMEDQLRGQSYEDLTNEADVLRNDMAQERGGLDPFANKMDPIPVQQPAVPVNTPKDIEMPEGAVTAPQNPIIALQDRYKNQAMAPTAEGYSPDQIAKARDSQSLRDLFGALNVNANQIGNYRGQVAQTNVPDFMKTLNTRSEQDIAQKQTDADRANKLQQESVGTYTNLLKQPYEMQMLQDKAQVSGLDLGSRKVEAENQDYMVNSLDPEIQKALTDNKIPLMDKPTLYKMAATNPIYKMLSDAQAKKDALKEAELGRQNDLQKAQIANKAKEAAQLRTPQADRAKIQDRDEAFLRATEAANLAKNAYTGPASVIIADWMRSPKGSEAQSAILQMTNAYNKMISGGAITPQEGERLRRAMPNMNDTAANFKVKMDLYLRELKDINDNHLNMLDQEGFDTTPYRNSIPSNNQPVVNKPSGIRVISDSEEL